MDERGEDDRLAAVAALGDPLRRALYRFVAGQDQPVSRDQAAEAVRASRSAAAFHLDRLVEAGLVEAEYRRLSGRSGPGAGRPSKLYRRSAQEIAVSLPARRYDLAADLLASAVTASIASSEPVAAAVRQVARRRGEVLAQSASVHRGSRSSRSWKAQAAVAISVLGDDGYEPRQVGDEIVLANCPFHSLVGEHAELVCAMNLAMLEGFADTLPRPGVVARLEPSPGRCCVRIHRADPSERST